MSRPGRAARLAGAAIVSLVLLTVLPAAPTLGLSKTACRVRHVETATTYRSLAAAVAAATSGDHLTVRGVCHGTATIDADLTITGIRPRGAVKPVLDGDDGGSVLTIRTTRTVTVASLSIIDGSGSPCLTTLTCGGGIHNEGALMLRHVIVRNNAVTGDGGGIWSHGALTLAGTSAVRANTASGQGGGVYKSAGIVTLQDRSSIAANTAAYGGGVVNNAPGALVLDDASAIHHNTATAYGGGVFNYGTLTIGGTAAIRDNIASMGGGIYYLAASFDPVACAIFPATDQPIHSNSPDNCSLFE